MKDGTTTISNKEMNQSSMLTDFLESKQVHVLLEKLHFME